MHELEDIVLEDSTKSDDHIVPCHNDKINESIGLTDEGNNEPQHEVKTTVGKITYSGGSVIDGQLWKEASFYPSKEVGSATLRGSRSSASDKAVPVLDSAHISNTTALAYQDAGSSGSYVKDCSTDTGKDALFSKDPTLGTGSTAYDNEGHHFSLKDTSPAVYDFGLLENKHKDVENDLLDYDWPDMGNFEDMDMLLRHCDTTFEQGSTGNTDELSWFSSSSHAIYGPDDTFQSGLQSSYSELGALNSTSDPYGANTNFMPEKDSRSADYDKCSSLRYQSYTDWSDIDAETKRMYAHKEQINRQSKLLESQYSSSEKRKPQAVEHTRNDYSHGGGQSKQISDQKLLSSDNSVPQIHTSEVFSKKSYLFESSSSSKMSMCGPHMEVEHWLATDQVPFTNAALITKFENKTNPLVTCQVSDHNLNHVPQCMGEMPDHLFRPQLMKPEGNVETLHPRQQVYSRTLAERPSQMDIFSSAASIVKRRRRFQQENRNDNGNGRQIVERPAVEIDTSMVHGNSSMISECSDDMSVEAAGFQQLQDSVYQLDVRTKLCIRDSLYRLARSAEQRHSVANLNNYSSEIRDRRGLQGTEASKKSCAEFIDAETETNLVDRSIAHLLFHSPLETAARLVDDTTSLESHINNEQIHAP